jgi:hypothetical protein
LFDDEGLQINYLREQVFVCEKINSESCMGGNLEEREIWEEPLQALMFFAFFSAGKNYDLLMNENNNNNNFFINTIYLSRTTLPKNKYDR